jgi:hypothetical protein
MLVPMVFIMAQLNLRFDVRPLFPGESAVVTAFVRDAGALDRQVELEAPEGVEVETPPVRITDGGQVAWRVRAAQPGRHTLRVRVGDAAAAESTLVVNAGDARWSAVPQRSTSELVTAVLYPGDRPIPPGGPVKTIETTYPPLRVGMLGFEWSWVVWFFVLSMIAGFALKGVLGVEV